MLEEGLAASLEDARGQDYHLAMEVLHLREFHRAYELVKNAKSKEELIDHPMVDAVMAIIAEEARNR